MSHKTYYYNICNFTHYELSKNKLDILIKKYRSIQKVLKTNTLNSLFKTSSFICG